jgi:hypothetical protein
MLKDGSLLKEFIKIENGEKRNSFFVFLLVLFYEQCTISR